MPNKQKGWWNEFFTDLWLEFQQTWWPAEHTTKQCTVIEDLLKLTPGARVLDVPCGEGRISV